MRKLIECLSQKDLIPAFLAITVTVGYFGVLFVLLFVGVPVTGGEALLVLLGGLTTAWTGIIAYYFGSTASSKVKDKTIADMRKK